MEVGCLFSAEKKETPSFPFSSWTLLVVTTKTITYHLLIILHWPHSHVLPLASLHNIILFVQLRQAFRSCRCYSARELFLLTQSWIDLESSFVWCLGKATNETYIDRIAAFGPRLTEQGLVGHLVPPTHQQDRFGCEPVTPPCDTWIALIERGECSFVDKVRMMQASGAIAVIVGDKHYNGWITMYAPGIISEREQREGDAPI